MTAAKDPCAFEGTLELLGRKHVLGILRLLHAKSPRRFTDLQAATGVSPKVLTERLKGLLDAGIVARTVFAEVPPRVEYSLTAKGKELGTVFRPIERWHAKYATS